MQAQKLSPSGQRSRRVSPTNQHAGTVTSPPTMWASCVMPALLLTLVDRLMPALLEAAAAAGPTRRLLLRRTPPLKHTKLDYLREQLPSPRPVAPGSAASPRSSRR